MITTLPETTKAPARAKQVSQFLAHLAMLLGWPDPKADGLLSDSPFKGPSGLPCRLRMNEDTEAIAIRPEVMLPIAAIELFGSETAHLLTYQARLITDIGWFVGLSPEGLLQLSSIGWFEKPEQVALALDLGNALATALMEEMLSKPSGQAFAG
jgi:hypothetical protein